MPAPTRRVRVEKQQVSRQCHDHCHLLSLFFSLLPVFTAGGRHPAKANKPKKMTKVKDHQILSCAANTHCSALVTNDGKLFLFGNIEDDIVDKSSGTMNCGSPTSLLPHFSSSFSPFLSLCFSLSFPFISSYSEFHISYIYTCTVPLFVVTCSPVPPLSPPPPPPPPPPPLQVW